MKKSAQLCCALETVEKHSFSSSLSIETTLPIENSAVCARLSGTLDSGLYKKIVKINKCNDMMI